MTYKILTISLLLLFIVSSTGVNAQRNETKATDSNTPLHLLKPDYPTPYGQPDVAAIVRALNKIHAYLDAVTPPQYMDVKTGQMLFDFSKIDTNTALKKGDFRIVSYEWGVTYGAMYLASAFRPLGFVSGNFCDCYIYILFCASHQQRLD